MNKDEFYCQIGRMVDRKEIKSYTMLCDNLTINVLKERYKHIDFKEKVFYPLVREDEFIIYKNNLINNNTIDNPCRSDKCKHIETVDLIEMIESIYEYKKCPLCFVQCDLNIIYVDVSLKTLLNILNKSEYSFIIIKRYKPDEYRLFDEKIPNYDIVDKMKEDLDILSYLEVCNFINNSEIKFGDIISDEI